jgi:hypothetical protein
MTPSGFFFIGSLLFTVVTVITMYNMGRCYVSHVLKRGMLSRVLDIRRASAIVLASGCAGYRSKGRVISVMAYDVIKGLAALNTCRLMVADLCAAAVSIGSVAGSPDNLLVRRRRMWTQ